MKLLLKIKNGTPPMRKVRGIVSYIYVISFFKNWCLFSGLASVVHGILLKIDDHLSFAICCSLNPTGN